MRLKSASLDLIAKANNKLTGDELRAQRKAEEDARRKAEMDALPCYMNSRKRRALRKVLAKAQLQENDE